MSYQIDKFREIANAIKDRTGDATVKPSQFAEKVHEVFIVGYSKGASEQYPIGYQNGYDTGYNDGHENGLNEGKALGYSEGHSAGIDEGKQAEKERFFYDYQLYPDKDDYDFRFAGIGWNNTTFTPRYNIAPKSRAISMFARTGIKGDLVAILEALNITLDFSQCKLTQNLFANANGITRLGVMDFSNMGSSYGSEFNGMTALVTIDKLISSEKTSYSSMFLNNNSLVNLTWEGVIAKNGVNLSKSTKLSHDSFVSTVNTLSTTTSGLAVTLSLQAVNKAFETSAGANDGSTSAEWKTLIGTRPNWTISLV